MYKQLTNINKIDKSITSLLSTEEALSDTTFNSLMQLFNIADNSTIAVAVSGGSDSLCLVLLLQRWIQALNISSNHSVNLVALIVNHKLRSNMAREIAQVKGWLKRYNIHTKTLSINPISTNSKVQQNARLERYRVLIKYCQKHNISFLAVGHHLNDLIETVAMRELRAVTIWGNSGISRIKNLGSTLLIRPLLFIPKACIVATLNKFNQPWVEDPSNANLKYERNYIRTTLFNQSEFNYQQWLQKIIDFRYNRITLEQDCLNFLIKCVRVNNLGIINCNLTQLLQLNPLLQKAILGLIIKFISQRDYMVKLDKLVSLLNFLITTLAKGKKHTKYSLGGVIIYINHKLTESTLTFIKEARAVNINNNLNCSQLKKDKNILWDNRFKLRNIETYNGQYYFTNLTPKEYNYLCKDNNFIQAIKHHGLTKEALCSVPWLFFKGNAISDWVYKLIGSKHVEFAPINSLFSELFVT